jgi:hypothetical protein
MKAISFDLANLQLIACAGPGKTEVVRATGLIFAPARWWLSRPGQHRGFQWPSFVGQGKRCHSHKERRHTELEKSFADFLDTATDVIRYFKNEYLGFSIIYCEGNRPRQYYLEFIVTTSENGREVMWVAETKAEIRPNTALKSATTGNLVRKDEHDYVRPMALPVYASEAARNGTCEGLRVFQGIGKRVHGTRTCNNKSSNVRGGSEWQRRATQRPSSFFMARVRAEHERVDAT